MIGPHRLPCETPEAQPCLGVRSTRWVLPATILGSSLSFIDGSVVNVALPAIAGDLGAGMAALQWMVNGYMLTFASLILLGGSAGDRFGRRRVFMLGLVGFAAASVLCGLAPSAGWLVAFRLAQGVTAALLVPASLALIGAAYSGEARGRAIGTWAAAGALTTALGPMLGGWLVDTVGWRAIFFVNPPVAALALVFAARLAPDARARREGAARRDRGAPGGGGARAGQLRPDRPRPGDAVAGRPRRRRGGARGLGLPAGRGAGAGADDAARSLPQPDLRRGERADRAALCGAERGAVPAALRADQVHGYSATAAGAAFLPFSAILGVGSRRAGGIAERIGARAPLVLGPAAHRRPGSSILGLSARWRATGPASCRGWSSSPSA